MQEVLEFVGVGNHGNKDKINEDQRGHVLALLVWVSILTQSINQSINQLYLNTVNGSASWFSDMPCKNYKV